MTEERRKEIDSIVSELTKEFHNNASNGDGRFGVIYLSADLQINNAQTSVEASREAFIKMILTLMEQSQSAAHDVLLAAENYMIKHPN